MVSLALAGDLPLSVVSPEILVEKGEELSKISHRIVNEIDSTSSTFEQCFKAIFEHCKITIGEDLYEESTANEVNFLTELCVKFNNYIQYSILKEIDIDGYLKDAKDYFEFFISKCNQIEDMVTFRNAFAINNEYVSSTADAILEETIAANINMNEILTAVINGKCQYSAWDKVAKGLNLNDSIARNIINHPELFSESDIREIIRKARSLGIFNSAFELLNGLTDALRSVEVMNVMKDLSQDFKLELFNDLLHSVKIEGFGVEVIDMIENMAKEYYIPSIKNFVDMMANIKSWSWIREITKVRKNIPDVIHNLVSHEIDEYIQQTLGVNASVKDQIEAIDDGYLDIIKSWKDLYNVHTITTIDIDTILNPRFTSYCEEDISALIILIKEEKKYHECLYLAKKIGETIYSETDQFIFKEIPSNEYYKLWLSGIGNQYSDEMFVTAIKYKPSDIYVNTGLGQGLRLSKHSIYRKCADILDKIRERHSDVSRDKIMNLVLEGLNPRGNRNDFQTYLALVEYASLHQIDINFGAPETCLDLKVALWYLDILKKMSFTELKPYIVLFRPCQQQRVLKKVFHLYDRLGLVPNITNIYNLFEYRTEYLSYIAPDDDEGMFDFSCRIVLHSLNQYTPESGYVFDREVFLDILIQQLTRNPKVKYSITGFFSKCDGRTKGWTKLNANNGSIKQVDGGYGITFNVKDVELYQLAADIKTIPGRVYDPSTYMWFIPAIESKKALQFARKSRLMFGFGPGNDYDRNPHLIQLNKTTEICREFCDGIQYGIIEGIDIPIIWCGAERCYQPCRDRHNEDRWEEYTMLDFCRILNYNTDSIDRQGEIIPNGRYLMFVSWVNWFNMMLEHLYCRECGHILSPVEISTLGRYSVTTFVCQNDCCNSNDSIYLNTCLNKDCRSVIDSRDCCQCPNEWYICPTCGSCCSNDMIGRRYEALRFHKKTISPTLRRAYEEKSGHVDSNTVFCYKCGNQTEVRDGQYYCKRCNEIISYKNRRTRK